MNANKFIIILFMSCLLCSCASLAAPTPTATPSPTPSLTSTSIPSPIASHTPYPMPELPIVTATKSPPTPTMLPERPLSQDGPWVVVNAPDAFYALNTDGTGLTRIFEKEADARYHVSSISPHGGYIAIHQLGDYGIFERNWVEQYLLILRVKDGRLLRSLPLANSDPTGLKIFGNFFDMNTDELNSPMRIGLDTPFESAWSPDGTKVAYTGSAEGPTADAYLYSTQTSSISRLTSGSAQSAVLSWSPDGGYIYNIGVDWPARSEYDTMEGQFVSGAWAVKPDGETIYLYDPQSTWEYLVGWTDEHTFITYSQNTNYETHDSENYNLRSYNIETGEEKVFWNSYFYDLIAYDLDGPTFLLQVDISDKNGDETAPGIYFVSSDKKTKLLVDTSEQQGMWVPEKGYYVFGSPSKGYKFLDPETADSYASVSAIFPSNYRIRYILDNGVWIGWNGTYLLPSDSTPKQFPLLSVKKITRLPGSNDLLLCSSNSDINALYIAREPDYVPILVTPKIGGCIVNIIMP